MQDNKRAAEYATPQEFCAIFQRDMNRLYLLSLLLTANNQQAEEVFAAGLERCLSGTPVFRAWARSWAGRAILEAAISVLRPAPFSRGRRQQDDAHGEVGGGSFEGIGPVLQLAPFDRFVFMMSALLQLSDRESAILLGCTVAELLQARRRAFGELSDAGGTHEPEVALQMAV